jgi:hypothetical protein
MSEPRRSSVFVGGHCRRASRRFHRSRRPIVNAPASRIPSEVTKPPPLRGLHEERMKGLEPSTFCMASSSWKVPTCPLPLQTAQIYGPERAATMRANRIEFVRVPGTNPERARRDRLNRDGRVPLPALGAIPRTSDGTTRERARPFSSARLGSSPVSPTFGNRATARFPSFSALTELPMCYQFRCRAAVHTGSLRAAPPRFGSRCARPCRAGGSSGARDCPAEGVADLSVDGADRRTRPHSPAVACRSRPQDMTVVEENVRSVSRSWDRWSHVDDQR